MTRRHREGRRMRRREEGGSRRMRETG